MVTQPGQPPGNSVRGLLFGSVAERYERYRLDYPDELVDTVLATPGGLCAPRSRSAPAPEKQRDRSRRVASRSPRSTRRRHGHSVGEGDAGTFREADSNDLRALQAETRVDLVYSAAAWHWTSPVTRWAQTVDLLVPGGVLALFGTPAELKDPDLFAAVDEIEKSLLPEDDTADLHPWSNQEMAAADGLANVEQRELSSVTTTTAADFVGRLATVSGYLQLVPEQRAEALRQVRAVLPDHVDVDTTVQLSLARRVNHRVS